MNTAMASFNVTVRQMSEMSQGKKTQSAGITEVFARSDNDRWWVGACNPR